MESISDYQKRTYKDKANSLLTEFLSNHQVKDAIDLGCGSGNETVYMIKKGIKVLSVDKHLNKNFILDRLTDNEKKNVVFMENSFENVILPKTDLIVAFFSIPFCSRDEFDNLWNKIYDSVNENGYFIGQLFGDRGVWNPSLNVNTFTKEKIEEYLKLYKIILFEEKEFIRKSDNKKWHYFDIIAKKTK